MLDLLLVRTHNYGGLLLLLLLLVINDSYSRLVQRASGEEQETLMTTWLLELRFHLGGEEV